MMVDMESKLVRVAEGAFPSYGKATVENIEHVTSGWESDIYLFRAVFERGRAENLVIRLYPGERQGAAGKAEGEYRALRLLNQAGYPVPRVDALDVSGAIFEPPWILMERIEGSTLSGRMYGSKDPTERRQSLELFCKLFVDLHNLEWDKWVPVEYQVHPRTRTDLLDRMFTQGQAMMQALPLPGFLPVMEWLQERREEAGGTRVSLIHLDFHAENILYRPDGKAFVIDWTNIDLSDYRVDLAWTLLLTLCYNGPQWREAILHEYERQSGLQVEHLEFYDVLACVRRLYSIVGSLRYGAGALGMRPGAENVMRQQAAQARVVYELMKSHTGIRIPEVEEL